MGGVICAATLGETLPPEGVIGFKNFGVGGGRMSQRFEFLKNFLTHKMRMSHIYQPAMIRTLLESGGVADAERIAKVLLSYDRAQIDYYVQITKNMVGKVLTRNHQIAVREKNQYSLVGFDDLSSKEIEELILECDRKIEEYIEKRGNKIWSHRTRSGDYVPGSLRYDVLKRAKFRCELCGVSADERALEVDHIIPRSRGGTNDVTNFQALCNACNGAKNNRDDTDFRGVVESYKHRERDCPFCNQSESNTVAENELAYAIRDRYPVTALHTLVIPKRHVQDYFDLYQPERNAIEFLLRDERSRILETDRAVTGFNVGNNSGASAGQTVFHCHIHLIPRRDGDVADPRGGVRGVIPSKQSC